ncbi:hypothetical protein [Streptomyces justiciae]|uniref:Uncharacterized protein n=1 Tax=Streptomyces justiciae TaxID=2780140 RepID=A0ABU3M6R4_9ACTN|nr:hypothetical protein [Streptomyces justiciae]MDT7847216.1 hypothetical protein [Streptomyces justiciae]
MIRLGVEGGPADGAEVVVEVDGSGQPPGEMEISHARYVLRMFGADPHPDEEWHYCWVRTGAAPARRP